MPARFIATAWPGEYGPNVVMDRFSREELPQTRVEALRGVAWRRCSRWVSSPRCSTTCLGANNRLIPANRSPAIQPALPRPRDRTTPCNSPNLFVNRTGKSTHIPHVADGPRGQPGRSSAPAVRSMLGGDPVRQPAFVERPEGALPARRTGPSYERREVPLRRPRPDWYLALNPRRRSPDARRRRLLLAESNTILRYLATRAGRADPTLPSPPTVPASTSSWTAGRRRSVRRFYRVESHVFGFHGPSTSTPPGCGRGHHRHAGGARLARRRRHRPRDADDRRLRRGPGLFRGGALPIELVAYPVVAPAAHRSSSRPSSSRTVR